MAINLSRLFEKITFWRQPEEAPKPREAAEQRLHRRDSMLLELLTLMKANDPSKKFERRNLLEQIYINFSEQDENTDAAILKTIDILAETAPAEAAENLRMLAYYLTSHHKENIDSTVNRELAQRCISLADQLPRRKENVDILYYAIQFAPSLAQATADKFEELLNVQPAEDKFAYIDNQFRSKPGTTPVFEHKILNMMQKALEVDPAPEYALTACRAIAAYSTESREREAATDRWFTIVTSVLPRHEALKEIERQRYDNIYTPDILRDRGIRALMQLAGKAASTTARAEIFRSAAQDQTKSGNAAITKLAAERWLECANDQDLIDEAKYGDSYMDQISRQRILDLAESRTPENAVRLLDQAARACEDENYFKQKKFYAQVTEKWAALLKEKIPAEQAYNHLRMIEGRGSRVAARRETVVADIFLSLTDKLPLRVGIESAKHAVWTAESAELKSLLAGGAQKWANLVRQLPPEEGLEEIKSVRNSYGELKKHAEILERELCGKVACGIRPEEFLKQLSDGPG